MFLESAGFASMLPSAGSPAYVLECVTPSYAAQARPRLSASFENFYTAPMVKRSDGVVLQCVAGMGADVGFDNQTSTSVRGKGLLVAVMGKEHVKFGYEVPSTSAEFGVQRQDMYCDAECTRGCRVRLEGRCTQVVA